MNLVIYGAVTAYVLPVAYSLLGACAFALRNMAAQTGTKTYQPSYSNRARLIIALIAGTVVGLFNNFTQGVSVSPLAIAFLVGYAVEVFFSFLDAFVHTFESVRNPRGLGASASA
jgi:xanthine/uracil permease